MQRDPIWRLMVRRLEEGMGTEGEGRRDQGKGTSWSAMDSLERMRPEAREEPNTGLQDIDSLRLHFQHGLGSANGRWRASSDWRTREELY